MSVVDHVRLKLKCCDDGKRFFMVVERTIELYY